MNDKFTCYLVGNVPDQSKDADLKANDVDKRCFRGYWLVKRLCSGNLVSRNWIMYEYIKTNKSWFSFPCILFSKQNNTLSRPQILYSDQESLHPHNYSVSPDTIFFKWKPMEKHRVLFAELPN